jgi:methionyl-tRNA formyltransferase
MIKIVFFGTPDIGLKSLDYLYNSKNIEVCAVVTQPDKPAGRGHKLQASPIKKYALEHNIPIYQPKSIRKEPEIINELKKYEPDFFVTFAFGQILSQEVLDVPKYETINLHASLLPKYRGANPIQRAIINGDKETGICTMITELGLDCGDICQKLVIPISETMNCEQLWNEIGEKSPKMIEQTLIVLKEKSIKPHKQCEEGVCMGNKLSKEEFLIDWSKTNTQLHNLVRGI